MDKNQYLLMISPLKVLPIHVNHCYVMQHDVTQPYGQKITFQQPVMSCLRVTGHRKICTGHKRTINTDKQTLM